MVNCILANHWSFVLQDVILLGTISSFIVDVKAIFIICLNKKNCSGQIVFVFAMLCTPSLFMLLSLFIFPSLPL